MGIKIFVGNTGYSEAGGKKWGNKGIKNFGIFLVLRRKTGLRRARLLLNYPVVGARMRYKMCKCAMPAGTDTAMPPHGKGNCKE